MPLEEMGEQEEWDAKRALMVTPSRPSCRSQAATLGREIRGLLCLLMRALQHKHKGAAGKNIKRSGLSEGNSVKVALQVWGQQPPMPFPLSPARPFQDNPPSHPLSSCITQRKGTCW